MRLMSRARSLESQLAEVASHQLLLLACEVSCYVVWALVGCGNCLVVCGPHPNQPYLWSYHQSHHKNNIVHRSMPLNDNLDILKTKCQPLMPIHVSWIANPQNLNSPDRLSRPSRQESELPIRPSNSKSHWPVNGLHVAGFLLMALKDDHWLPQSTEQLFVCRHSCKSLRCSQSQ